MQTIKALEELQLALSELVPVAGALLTSIVARVPSASIWWMAVCKFFSLNSYRF